MYNGDAWQGTAVITSGSAIGVEDAVVPAIADTFCVEVTSIVCTPTGVETWDAGEFDVMVDDDRVPAA